MNKINCVLHNKWRMIEKVYNKNNINKIVNFGIAMCMLFIIMFVPRIHGVKQNTVSVSSFDSFSSEITKNDKLEYILNKYNLTNYQFKVLSAIVIAESQSNSYEDAYAVINTIYNRTHAKNWVRSCANYFGQKNGNNLYYQAIMPNQFVVYEHGTYQRYLNNESLVGYDAIIDFLYNETIMHNYLSFRANSVKVNGSEKFSNNGNNYFNILIDSNKI